MKRIVAAMGMSVCVGVVAAAQTGTMPKAQMDKGMMKDGAMTVAGCVAAGKNAGQYMLTNAMMSPMMDKDKPAAEGHMMSGHMMSYELVGGDLKGHVGHKVEVMGSMSKADMDKMHATGKMGKDSMGKDKVAMADKDMKAMKFTVTSVKMISPTCP